MLNVKYTYEIEAVTEADEQLTSVGQAETGYDLEEYMDDGLLFSGAAEAAISDFYSFEVEKAGHSGLKEITVTIKNMSVGD